MNHLKLCKLCQKRPANKTGSHVLPFSLISTSITENASGKRDKEIMYQLSPSNTYKYIARSVLPEKIEEEALVSSNIEIIESNLAAVDYEFCTICENRFGNIEEYFFANVIKKLKNSAFNDNAEITNIQLDNIDVRLIYLYVYLIFWRCSVTNIYSIYLNKSFEEELRIILDIYLEEGNIKKVINKLNKNSSLPAYSFFCFYFFEREDDTVNTIVGTQYDKGTQLIIANRFGFLLKPSDNYNDKTIMADFYSINRELSKYVFNNEEFNKFQVLKLNKEISDIIHECIVEEYIRDYTDKHKNDFINYYKLNTNRNPSHSIINFYINNLYSLGVNVHPKQIDNLKQFVLRRFNI